MWLFDSNDELDLKVNHALHRAKRSLNSHNSKDLTADANINAAGQQAIQADLVAEHAFLQTLIREKLNGILYSEESGVKEFGNQDAEDKIVLLLDPLDGSQNFRKGIPIGCISVAYGPYSQNPTLGNLIKAGILSIYTDEMFFAQRGKGAYYNGEKLNNIHDLNGRDDLQVSYYGYGKLSRNRILEKFDSFSLRSFGSAAWELALIAADRNDAYVDLRNVLKPHDFAGARIVIEETGGTFNFMTLNNFNNPDEIPLDDFKTGYSVISSKSKELVDEIKNDILVKIL